MASSNEEQINIKKLQVVDTIQPGTYILVQAPNGTSLIDYKDFIIGLDNITFDVMLSSFATDIDALSAQLLALDTNTSVQIDSVSALFFTYIDSITANIDTIQTTLTAQSDSIDGLTDDVNVLTTNVEDISASNAELSADIDAINLDIDDLTNYCNYLSSVISSVYTTVQSHSAAGTW